VCNASKKSSKLPVLLLLVVVLLLRPGLRALLRLR
jgi:hypothetical protein